MVSALPGLRSKLSSIKYFGSSWSSCVYGEEVLAPESTAS
ncbi:hypothetical protein PC123_g15836 [Phytophthora cactorum]|nr:hypothetical protein PC123_g15836 [Phytophthora cactorum]